MDLSDFDFALPPSQIAKHPAEARDGSRLLHLRRDDGSHEHLAFADFPDLLSPADALVVNDAKVFPARLQARRMSGGGRIELLLIHRTEEGCWQALGKPTRRLKESERLELVAGDRPGAAIRVLAIGPDGRLSIRFEGGRPDREIIRAHGEVPLPPYLQRRPISEDFERYQTVYARSEGAVAAPTAGLHFTLDMIGRLRQVGVGVIPLTLNVGPGTFEPVRKTDPRKHRLEAEWYELGESEAGEICRRKRAGGRIVAVGTTTARTLETLASEEGLVRGGAGWTKCYILPPYRFRAVDALLTNFHLPRSTLLLLVSAFAGTDAVLAAYREAVAAGYRFYSYGDAMFIS